MSETLSETEARTLELREAAAARKLAEIQRRRFALEDGAKRKTSEPLAKAVDRFFTEREAELYPRTAKLYRAAANKLVAFHPGGCDELDKRELMAFRAALIAEPATRALPGGKVGERVATKRKRRPASINQELRAVKTVLSYLAKGDAFAKLRRSDVSDALPLMSVQLDEPEPLTPGVLRALLAAAKGDEAEALIAFVLLSGYRLAHALKIPWSAVRDDRIAPPASIGSKTKRPGVVFFRYSPALKKLLDALPRMGPSIFAGWSLARARAARARLSSVAWDFQSLRVTNASYLANLPGVSPYAAAGSLGHGVLVAERHYVGRVHVAGDTLETAMGVADEIGEIVAHWRGR